MNIEALQAIAQARMEATTEVDNRTIDEKILELDRELDSFSDTRSTINKLKEKKDQLILEYIQDTRQPKILDKMLINYKALFFFFKEAFIEVNNKFLSFDKYTNDTTKIYSTNRTIFEEAFGDEKRIYLDIKTTNFPHLIGYKQNERDQFGDYDNTKNKLFLNSIYYETNLLDDYEHHGCDIDKITTISWIWNTLEKPHYVFKQNGLVPGKSLLKTDLLFVRKKYDFDLKTETYHYVSLIKINSNCKNKYVINSHHPITKDAFSVKFNTNNAIFVWKK